MEALRETLTPVLINCSSRVNRGRVQIGERVSTVKKPELFERAARLVEQATVCTSEIFETSIGNVPANNTAWSIQALLYLSTQELFLASSQ